MAHQDANRAPRLILKEREAARALSLSVALLRRLRAAGKGPRVVWLSTRRLGYRLRDLEAWTDSLAA